MRVVLELGTTAAAALARRAVQHRRPVALEAQRLIERALGLADCDCQPGPKRLAEGKDEGEEVGR